MVKTMELPQYERDETIFLEETATRFGFKDKYHFVFVQRFQKANDDLDHNNFAETFEENLQEGCKPDVVPLHILRDKLKEIFPLLEKAGCPLNGVKKDKCDIAKVWLRETIYPQWHYWRQLKLKATQTDKMGPKLAPEISTLEMWESPSNYLPTVRLGSQIQIHIELETTGHLILLEKGTSGKLWCLCPSFFAPQSYLKPGKVVLPQENSRQKSFKVSGIPGKEEIVAIIAPTSPPFPWLPKPDQNPLQLQEIHLQELLEYFEGRPESSILYMDYAITSS
jgi:Domain of unknown function (DUF4384)